MPDKIGLLWEQTDESEDSLSSCIRGDAPAFAAAAAILLSYIQSIPTQEQIDHLKRSYERRVPFDLTGVLRIASQLGSTSGDDCAEQPDLCDVYESAPTLESLLNDYYICFGDSPLSYLRYRNKPDDDCTVQVSTNGGTTWVDAWSMDGCSDPTVNNYINSSDYYTAYYTVAQSDINHFQSNYETSIEDIYPDLMPESDNEDERTNALCHSLVHLVDTISDASVDYYQSRDEAQTQINIGLAISAAILAVISVAATPVSGGTSILGLGAAATIWGAAMGVGSAIGNAMYDKWQETSIEQYQNQSARNEVVCYLNDLFSEIDVSQVSFQAGLSAFTGSSDAMAIADVLEISISIPETYAAFTGFWQRSHDFIMSSETFYDDCPCGDDNGWCFEYDFTAGIGNGFEVYPGQAVLETGGFTYDPSGYVTRCTFFVRLASPVHVDRIEIDRSAAGTGNQHDITIYANDGANPPGAFSEIDRADDISPTTTILIGGDLQYFSIDIVSDTLVSGGGLTPINGYAQRLRLISDTGTNPLGENCE